VVELDLTVGEFMTNQLQMARLKRGDSTPITSRVTITFRMIDYEKTIVMPVVKCYDDVVKKNPTYSDQIMYEVVS